LSTLYRLICTLFLNYNELVWRLLIEFPDSRLGDLLRPELGETHARVRARRDSIIGDGLKHALRDLLAHTSILDQLDFLVLFLHGRRGK
jgi:hypothetical protein